MFTILIIFSPVAHFAPPYYQLFEAYFFNKIILQIVENCYEYISLAQGISRNLIDTHKIVISIPKTLF